MNNMQEKHSANRRDMAEKGCAYGVGTGPGDPELMTLKAVRILQEADVIACSGNDPEKCAAYRTAVRAVPEIALKETVSIAVPMTYDRAVQEKEHLDSARRIAVYLEAGKNVAFLILGDPTIYSSFSYYRRILEEEGYHTEIISGVPSFCAAAAKLDIPLVEWEQQMHIIPAAHQKDLENEYPGTTVYMKTGKRLKDLKEHLTRTPHEVYAVENCGMEGEKVSVGTEGMPDQSGYYTTVIIKEKSSICQDKEK